jgi:nitrite reductase/ring-hydroxylating ferredoxin subunit
MAEFVKVASTGEILQGMMKKVMLGTKAVLVANVSGKYYAIGDVSTHAAGPLHQSKLIGNEVECPWHGSHFDMTTGQIKRGPAWRPEPSYEVMIEGTEIKLRPKQ